MSRSGLIELPFAGEQRKFRLGIGEWREVQERCDAGPPVIAQRLALSERPEEMQLMQWLGLGGMGAWRVDDIREPIFQGLIGGGMDSAAATALVVKYVDGEPLLGKAPLALKIVLASLIGGEDEDAGEPKGETA